MKKHSAISTAAACLLLIGSQTHAEKSSSVIDPATIPGMYATTKPLVAVVEYVADGDTLYLRFPNNSWSYEANLLGVDAPGVREWFGSCYANEATIYLKKKLQGRKVIVEWDSRDKVTRRGGRLLVYLKDPATKEDINAGMIAKGYGLVPPRFKSDRDKKYLPLELRAMKTKVGMWGACKPNAPLRNYISLRKINSQ